jgi:hypothetical protein
MTHVSTTPFHSNFLIFLIGIFIKINVCNVKCWLDSLVVYEKTYCILNLEICFEEHLENILSIHMNKLL